MEKKKIALVVGHTKKNPGACNLNLSICEFEFNDKLVKKIDCLVDERCETKIVYRDTYKALPDKINELNPDFVICFHANAFDTRVIGAETLYYHKSKKGKKIAEIFQNNLVGMLGLYDRGIRPRSSEQRGGYILQMTDAPCIILEPFFIDNDEECKRISKDWKKLAAVCRDSIYEVIKTI
jgi:N-acetylmuramoyl-L-alanine amidase